MTLKFSQFTAATSPAYTDKIAGTSGAGAGANRQFTAGQTGIIPANGNITFYVAPGGNDATAVPGDITHPFLTGQGAANAATRFDWQNNWQWTVQFADGTYSAANFTMVLTAFLNNEAGGNIFGHSGDATKVITNGHFQWLSCDLTVQIGWFTFTTNRGDAGSVVNPQNGSFGVTGDLIFQGDSTPFYAEGKSFIIIGANITVTMTAPGNSGNLLWFIFAAPGVVEVLGAITITLPATLTITNGWISAIGAVDQTDIGVTQVQIGNPTYVNKGGVSGPRFDHLIQGAILRISPNGELTDLPGTTMGTVDGTAIVENFNRDKQGVTVRPIALTAATITTAMIPQGCASTIKDTTGGSTYYATNDGGTIKKVQLT